MAGVYNAAAQTLDIYVNGVLDDGVLTGTVPAAQVPSAVNAAIGMRSGGFYFNGVIDDLRIYSRALSATEIQADMNTAVGTIVATPPTVSSLQCSPTSVAAGASSTCTVTLSAAAPTGGSVVTLSDNSSAITTPASATVAAGASTASFTVTAGSVTSTQSVTITAALNGSSTTAAVTVTAPAVTLTKLACSPTSVAAGASSTCTVTLSAAAPTGGSVVTLSDNSSAITTPASATVAAGASTASFTVTAGSVTSTQSVTITAALNGSSTTAAVTVTAPAVTLTKLACSPTSVAAGASSTCTVTLSAAAPSGGSVVTLSDNSSAITTPASATVAAGASTASFTVTAGSVTSTQSVTITAALNGSSTTAAVTVTAPAVTLTKLACSPTSVAAGASSTCTVTLSAAAPSGGSAVTLSDNSSAITTPASATVAAGASTASFTVTAGSVTSTQSVTITAALNGSSATASLTLSTPTTTSLSAAYGFDEGTGKTTADTSGNGITGQIQGATWTTTGKYGSALSFNGTTNYVDLGSPVALQSTGSMTWSAWVYAAGTPPDDGQIVAMSRRRFRLATEDYSRHRSSHLRHRSFTRRKAHTQRYSKTVLALKKWYHVAGVYNAAAKTLDIYVNGVLDDGVLTGAVPAAQVLAAVPARIGMRSGGYYFNGTIDNVRIYSRALAASEIQADMNTPVTLPGALTTSAVKAPSQQCGSNCNATTAAQAGTTADGAASNQTDGAVSALSCSPRAASAGSQVNCELRVTASPRPRSLRLASSSDQVRVPAAVSTRSNQSSLAFQVSIDPLAKQQTATVTAALGESQVQDTILVTPGAPVLTDPGRQTAKFGNVVRFLVRAVDPNGLPVQLTARGIPAGASFEAAGGGFNWIPDESQMGQYAISFTASNSAGQSSTLQVPVEVDSGKPSLDSTEPPSCSPGAIAALSGSRLAAAGAILSDASGASTSLGGTRVKVNNDYVPVLFSSATQVKFLCPAFNPGTPLAIAVESDSGTTEPLASTMMEASPTIFPLDSSSGKQGLISFPAAKDLVMNRNFRIPAKPAQPGDPIVIWATGLGSGCGIGIRGGGRQYQWDRCSGGIGQRRTGPGWRVYHPDTGARGRYLRRRSIFTSRRGYPGWTAL